MKVAIVQMRVEMGRQQANLERALAGIAEAAANGAAIVVLPECPFLGWLSARVPELAEPVPGDTYGHLAAVASAHGLFVCSGITERAAGACHNAAVLIDPAGRLLIRHRKINELDVGLQVYTRGTGLAVAHTELGPLAVNICADNWVPCIDQTLHLMGARLILSPCAWACDPGSEEPNSESIRDYFRKRTTESPLYLVGANSVGALTEGPWQGRILHGRSLVYGPEGRELLAGDLNAEQVLYCDVPL